MNDSSVSSGPGSATPGREELFSGLFAQLVMQQANMAMMLLGKVPHPETGKPVKDIEAARLFIDQLEMLEAKTKGNLTKEEAGLLMQSLMSLRLTFVEAVDSSDTAAPGGPAPSDPAKMHVEQASQTAPGKTVAAAAGDEEHRKKFSKKY